MKFTQIIHRTPIGKKYWLGTDGNLAKQIIASRDTADVKVLECTSLKDVERLVRHATPNTYFVSGIATHQEAIALVGWKRVQVEREGKVMSAEGMPYIGFDNGSYPHQSVPSLFVIDTDGLQVVAVTDQLAAAVPGIETHAHLAMSSTGANIYCGDQQIKGLTGQHTIFVAADGTDIPRALDDLFKRLVLAGHFHIQVTPDGKCLVRTAVDRQLRVPSQPVFLHAHLGPGLEQRKAITVHQGIDLLDTRNLIKPLTDEEESRYAVMVADAKRAELPEMAETRRRYINKAVEKILASKPGMTQGSAQATIAKAMEGSTLYRDFLDTLSDGTQVSVEEILADPERYSRQTCRDPMEPDYGSATVAMIFLEQDVPVIHSFAHHGRSFRLVNTTLGAEFDLEKWLEDFAAADAEAINAEQGDVALDQWLKAETVFGKKRVPIVGGELAADEAALSLLRSKLEIEQETVIDVGDDRADEVAYPGIGLRYRVDDRAVHHVLSITAAETLITEWCKHDRDACLEGWADLVAEYSTITDESEPLFEVMIKHAVTTLKLPNKKAKEMLEDALSVQSARLSALVHRSRPRPVVEDAYLPDPAEIEAERQRRMIKQEADLLRRCRHIAERPLDAFYEAMKQSGVAGERDLTLFVYLIILSAHLHKPSSGLIRGPAGTGKSHSMKAVARLFPEEWVYHLSSMSAKALIYEPRSFSHNTILLEEAEALVRNNAEDKNEVAEMLRVLLSEGQLIHRTVGKDETGNMVTITKVVQGPTNLITSTTRAKLDEEISSRMIDHWSDTTSEHIQVVLGTLGKIASGDIDVAVDYDSWHAFAEWMRCGPRSVVFPYAEIISDGFTLAGARVYRDFNNLMAITKACALMHRLQRHTDDKGRLVTTIEDYRVAYQLLGERIDELAGERVPNKTLELFKKVQALVKARGSSIMEGEFMASQRELAKLLGVGKNSIAKELARLESNGLVEKSKSPYGGRNAKITLSIPSEAEQILAGEGRALITPDELEVAIF